MTVIHGTFLVKQPIEQTTNNNKRGMPQTQHGFVLCELVTAKWGLSQISANPSTILPIHAYFYITCNLLRFLKAINRIGFS